MDQKDGEAKEYKDGRRIYHIPESGILKTNFKSNTGLSDIDETKFFFRDNVGREIEIPDFIIKKDSLFAGCQIFFYGNGVLADRNIPYINFVVAPYSERNAYFRQNKDGILIEDNSIWDKVNSILSE